MCAHAAAHRTRAELQRVVDRWRETPGHRVYLLTLTIRHRVRWRQTLAETSQGVLKAWQRMQGGQVWKRFRESVGLESFRVLELTHGPNGWHPHLHVLVMTTVALPDDDAGQDMLPGSPGWLTARWIRCVAGVMGERNVPSMQHAVDLALWRPDGREARYMSKLVPEVTGQKTAKDGHRTPWQILSDCADHRDAGDEAALRVDGAIWRDYVRTMMGSKMNGWSKGLRPLRDQARKELKEEQRQRDADSTEVCVITSHDWEAVAEEPGALALILDAAEDRGEEGVRDAIRWIQSKKLRQNRTVA